MKNLQAIPPQGAARARAFTLSARGPLLGSEAALQAPVRLLPHELVFGFFLVLTWLRLVLSAGVAHGVTLAFLAYWMSTVAVIVWASRRPSSLRWRLRLLLYPALMGLSFYSLPAAMALLGQPRADELLVRWDQALLGQGLAGLNWQHPLLTDGLMLAYLFFFFYLLWGPGSYFFGDLRRFGQCFVGLFTIYGLGFIGYTILPAGGPHRWLEFSSPLPGGWLTHATKPFVDACSNGMDVFPSIHVAVSLYLLLFDWRYCRGRFWGVLLPCVGLWISTIYLRYHYGVDVLAGAALGLVGFGVAMGCRRMLAGPWPLTGAACCT